LSRPDRRILVAGWFTFPDTGATVGDLMAKDVVVRWLEEAGIDHDVALDTRYGEGVDWRTADPERYSHVVFVCGPFYRSDLLRRFEQSRLVGIDLSMVEPIEEWNPFDLLLERDSSQASRPDLAFVAPVRKRPVVGVCLLPPAEAKVAQDAYVEAVRAVERLLARHDVAPFEIDTELPATPLGLRSPAAVDSIIARADVIVTTRLHGLVLGLRNGVPVVAIDPVPGGERVLRQAETVGWATVLGPDQLDDAAIDAAFDACLDPDARDRARACADRARAEIGSIRRALIGALDEDHGQDGWGDGRRRRHWLFPEMTAAVAAGAPGGPGGGAKRAMRRVIRSVRSTLSRRPSP
jgi:hypothetical protein